MEVHPSLCWLTFPPCYPSSPPHYPSSLPRFCLPLPPVCLPSPLSVLSPLFSSSPPPYPSSLPLNRHPFPLSVFAPPYPSSPPPYPSSPPPNPSILLPIRLSSSLSVYPPPYPSILLPIRLSSSLSVYPSPISVFPSLYPSSLSVLRSPLSVLPSSFSSSPSPSPTYTHGRHTPPLPPPRTLFLKLCAFVPLALHHASHRALPPGVAAAVGSSASRTLFLKLCTFLWSHLSPYITPAIAPFLPAWQQQWEAVQAGLFSSSSAPSSGHTSRPTSRQPSRPSSRRGSSSGKQCKPDSFPQALRLPLVTPLALHHASHRALPPGVAAAVGSSASRTLFLKLCTFLWSHLSPYITPAIAPFLPAWQQQWEAVQAVLMDPCSQHALMADTHLLFLLLVALASLVRALQPAPRLGPGVTPEQLQQQHWLHHRRHVRVLEGSLYTVTVVLTMLVGLANLVVSLWYVWPGWRPEWSDCPIFEDLLPIVQCVAWFGMSWSVMEEKRQGATWHFFTLRLWWTSVFVLNSWSVIYSLVQMHKGVPLSVDAALGIIAWPISAFLFAVACQKPPPVHHPNEPLTESLLSGLPGVADQPTDPGVTPWERAGWWNVLTFQWINPLLAKGHEKPLDLPDIPFLADWDTADAAREAFYRTWDRIRLYTPLQQPSITWTLWLTYWRKFLAIAFWAGLETVLLYIGPSLLAEFVRVVGADVPVLTFGGGGAAEVCAAGVAGDAGAGGGSCSSSTGTWNVDLAGPLAALGTSLTGAFGLTGLFGSAASAASAVSAASVASAASAAASNLTATAQTIASATSATAVAAASSAAAFVTQTAATAAAAAAVPAAAAAAAAPAPSPGAPPDDPWAQWEGYWLCGVLLGCKLIETVAQHQFYFRSDILGMNVRAALTGHVFDKALRLSNAARHTHPMGEIVNYMALDVQRVADMMFQLNNLWTLPLQIVLALLLLHATVGPAGTLAGVATMVLMMWAQLLVAGQARECQKERTAWQDLRLKATTEALNNMKVIKLHAWEGRFLEQIEDYRAEEAAWLARYNYLMAANIVFLWMSPLLVASATFAACVAFEEPLSAASIFTAIATFRILQEPLRSFPDVLSSISQALVSLDRLARYQSAQEIEVTAVSWLSPEDTEDAVFVDGGAFTWDLPPPHLQHMHRPTLRGIGMQIGRGARVAICGPVGSGKSSLLSCILGEMHKLSGIVQVAGTIAHVPQTPWIQNGTIRDNVTFGLQMNRALYERVLRVCALAADLAVLPRGDETEIGERGINLSGGQKQRIQVARAVYHDADIYLLDDPFSSVDTATGSLIFDECVLGLLGAKTVLFVTNQLEFLPAADLILCSGNVIFHLVHSTTLHRSPLHSAALHDNPLPPPQVMRDGEIVQAGQYEELQRAGTDFSLLLDAHNDAMGSMDLPPPNPFQPSHTSHHHPQPQRAPSLGNILAANGDVFSRFDMDDQELATLLLGPQAGADGLGLASGGGSGGMGGPGMGAGDGLGGGASGVAADGSLVGVVGGAGGVVVGPMAAVAAAVASGAEDRQFGRVNAEVYRAYLTRAYGGSMVPIIVASQVLFQVLQIGANWWLAREVQPLHPAVLTWPDVRAYASLAIGSGLFVILRAFLSVHVGLRTADGFFQDMLHAVFRAPMAFFDSTPTGRTLARASADQNALDLQLFFNFGSVLNNLVQLLGIFLVTAAVTWPVIVVLIPLALLYVPLQRYYLSSSRELTRIDGLTKSPILAHFSETLAGAAVIRAFAQEERFEIENADAVDNNMRAYFHYYGAIYWLGLRLETISAVVLAFVAFLLVLVPQGTIEPGLAGVSLAYGLTLNMALVMTMWHLSNLENKLVAVDRIRHFSAIPSEAPLIVEGNRPSADWPNRGSISFENLQMRYREAMPLVLKGVTVTFRGGEKVGVVGRTGSGKSTLVVALFRLVEPVGGRVMIDGVDISTIGLQDLRSRLAIIPQDPTLFEGTVRSNLDPLGRYHSSLLWEVLEKCQLAEAVMDKEDKLDAIVVEGGENWSVGQRQLFCLARALLKRSRILVLDEATASVDSATDAIIQRTIKENFARATVITVAHRIPSVIDSDKVLVLEAAHRIPSVIDSDKVLVLEAGEGGACVHVCVGKGGRCAYEASQHTTSRAYHIPYVIGSEQVLVLEADCLYLSSPRFTHLSPLLSLFLSLSLLAYCSIALFPLRFHRTPTPTSPTAHQLADNH
ncbi:unnamed protein product [Closterium sp. Naga37s-1]|nr:unnamed protein product [Closterium sp. Naga37s-1]